MVYTDLDDEALFDLVKTDDARAFETLYNRFHDFLYVYAHKLTGNDSDSDEIIQTIFVNLWEKRSELAISGQLFAYLHRSVRYGFLNQQRNREVLGRYQQDLQQYLLRHDNPTESLLFEKELVSRLRELAQQLPGKGGQAFLMAYFDNYSHAEIAQALGISEKTVKNLLSHAAKDLRLRTGLAIALFFILS